MPGCLQNITTTGYGYVDPYVEKARNIVPLLDTTVQCIEPYFPPVIQATDKCIDVVHDTVGMQVAYMQVRKKPLQGKVSGLQIATTGRVHQLFGSVHALALGLIDRSEALVDQMLPPDEDEKKRIQERAQASSTVALIPRALGVPFKVPIRLTKIVYVKAGGLSDSVVQLGSNGCSFVSSKVSTVTAPGLAIISSGKASAAQKLQVALQSLADGKNFVVMQTGNQIYIVTSKLRLPEAKQFVFAKTEDLKQLTNEGRERAGKGAFSATKRIAGEHRAILIFDKIGLHAYVSASTVEAALSMLVGAAENEARKLVDGACL